MFHLDKAADSTVASPATLRVDQCHNHENAAWKLYPSCTTENVFTARGDVICLEACM